MYTQTRTYAHIRAYTSIYTHIDAYIRIYSHTRAYPRIYAHIHSYKRIYTHIHAYTRIYACTRIYSFQHSHTRIYMHIHTYTRIHTHTHAHHAYTLIYTRNSIGAQRGSKLSPHARQLNLCCHFNQFITKPSECIEKQAFAIIKMAREGVPIRSCAFSPPTPLQNPPCYIHKYIALTISFASS